MTLYELLEKNVKTMIATVGEHEKGSLYPLIMHEVERSLICIALQETKNNYFKTARILGLSRSTLYRKLLLFGLPFKKPKNFKSL